MSLTSARRATGIAALYAVLAAVFLWPIFEYPNGLGIIDWDEKLSFYGAVLKSVVEYGQLPYWNPWKCGGTVLWQSPLVPLLAPAYPLTAVVSLPLALKFEIFLHYWVGFLGMHVLLTEVLALEFFPLVVYLASVFTLSGAMAIHLEAGHSVFLPAFYLPWMLYFFLRGVRSGALRDAIAGGGVLALTIFNAGLHMVSMVIVTIAALAIVGSLWRRSWRPFVVAVTLGVSGALFAAPKLLPVVQYIIAPQFWDTRNPVEHPDRMTVKMLVRSFVDPYQFGRLRLDPLQRADWWEYGNYIGFLAAVLIVGSLLLVMITRRRRQAWLGWSLALTALLLLAWTAGEFSVLAPASLANHVWFFDRFRIPSRFTIPFVLVGVTLVGWTLKSLAVPQTRDLRLLAGIVCVLATAQLIDANRVLLIGVFQVRPVERGFRWMQGPSTIAVDHTSDPYGRESPQFRALMNDTAFYGCYESFQLTRAADPDHPLVFTTGEAQISGVRFTPNRVDFSVIGGRAPSTVLLNQNYGPGWHSNAGPVIVDAESRKPSIVLAPGQTGKFYFEFTAPGIVPGVAISLAACVAAWLVSKRRLGEPWPLDEASE